MTDKQNPLDFSAADLMPDWAQDRSTSKPERRADRPGGKTSSLAVRRVETVATAENLVAVTGESLVAGDEETPEADMIVPSEVVGVIAEISEAEIVVANTSPEIGLRRSRSLKELR